MEGYAHAIQMQVRSMRGGAEPAHGDGWRVKLGGSALVSSTRPARRSASSQEMEALVERLRGELAATQEALHELHELHEAGGGQDLQAARVIQLSKKACGGALALPATVAAVQLA